MHKPKNNLLNKGVSSLTGIAIIVAVAIVLFGGIFAYQHFTKQDFLVVFPLYLQNEQPSVNENQQNFVDQVMCTMDAKECPDGTFVGREGPKCEFKACPEVKTETITDWKIYTNGEYGFEIKYPEDSDIRTIKTEASPPTLVYIQLPISEKYKDVVLDKSFAVIDETNFTSGYSCPDEDLYLNTELVNIKINNIAAKKIIPAYSILNDENETVVTQYFIKKDNNCLKLETIISFKSGIESSIKDTESQIFNQIFSTLKLIN
jgi:hypothetical protein